MRQTKLRLTDDAARVVEDINRRTRLVPRTTLEGKARDLKKLATDDVE